MRLLYSKADCKQRCAVLLGQVWSREDKLSRKTRSIVTITALISKGIVDSSLTYHLSTARKKGVACIK